MSTDFDENSITEFTGYMKPETIKNNGVLVRYEKLVSKLLTK